MLNSKFELEVLLYYRRDCVRQLEQSLVKGLQYLLHWNMYSQF